MLSLRLPTIFLLFLCFAKILIHNFVNGVQSQKLCCDFISSTIEIITQIQKQQTVSSMRLSALLLLSLVLKLLKGVWPRVGHQHSKLQTQTAREL